MSQHWKNRVAIVTDARGIGARISVSLANMGVIVVGMARKTEIVEELNKVVTGNGRIYGRYCDITDEQSILDSFNWIKEKFFGIHILVNNVGVLNAKLLTESTTNEIRQIVDLNLLATSICLRETLRHMRGLKTKGHIIILNSVPEETVHSFGLYPFTKHAIIGLCQTVRQEILFLKLNIKFTTISLVDTNMFKDYSNKVNSLTKLVADDIAGAVKYALDTPEQQQVEEIILKL